MAANPVASMERGAVLCRAFRPFYLARYLDICAFGKYNVKVPNYFEREVLQRMRGCGERSGRAAHYNAADRNDKLIINLRDLSHTMHALYEGRGSQRRILIVLDEIGRSVTQRELTERLGIQPGSASEVVAKLEGAGHIRRTPNEADRRTVDIALTDAGRAVAAEAREQRTRRHEQMFSCLSDGEKDQLLSLLEKLNGDWEERYRDVGEGCRRRRHVHEGRQRGEA